MELSLSNFSLKKLLQTEQNTFNKARLKILWTILILSLFKVVIALFIVVYYGLTFQINQIVFVGALYLVLFKFFLSDRRFVGPITHIMLWNALILVWTIVFVSVRIVNIVAMQFIFMIILSSFYLLGKRMGLIYSLLSTVPVIVYMLFGSAVMPRDVFSGAELPSPGYEIVIILNFLTLIIAHYLYLQSFDSNIAEKEALNVKLLEAVKDANKAAQSKSDFLSTMSHELRTPLSSVIGMTDLLLDDPHSEEQEDNLKILKFSASSLHSLINDILDFNKLDSDKLHLEQVSVNLQSLMNDVCSGLRFHAKEKGLDLLLNVQEKIGEIRILSDPTRISQLIYNLGGNAVKFTSSGTITITVKIVEQTQDEVKVHFSVRDSGIGISTEKQQVIFEPFIQASTSTTRNYGGTGLGLAIVKQLLSLFDSSIQLESIPDKGSDFSFTIGFELDKQPDVHDPYVDKPRYDLGGLQVLVAEDNPMNRLLLKKVFSKWDTVPIFAVDGNEAVIAVTNGNFDVVLMDIHMPVLDGYAATRAIRKLPDPAKSSIKIIALTASVSHVQEKILKAGMNDYIYKPFDSKELYSRLKNIALQRSSHNKTGEKAL